MRHTFSLLLILAACVDTPTLDGTVTEAARNAPYPRLQPLDDLPAPIDTESETDGMADRLAELQRRAAALRAIDPGALQ